MKLRVVRKITHKKNQHGARQLHTNLPKQIAEAWGDATQIEWEINDRDLSKAVVRPVR